MNNNIFHQIINFFKNNKNQGLKWAVILTWIDFPLLYWSVITDNIPVMIIGMVLLILGNGFALYFG